MCFIVKIPVSTRHARSRCLWDALHRMSIKRSYLQRVFDELAQTGGAGMIAAAKIILSVWFLICGIICILSESWKEARGAVVSMVATGILLARAFGMCGGG